MGRIDLKTIETEDRILRLEYPNQDWHPYQWCKLYFVTENKETYLAARSLDVLLSKLLIAFMDIQDRRYISYKGMQNVFTISSLECSHSSLLGNQTDSGELDLIFEGTQGDIMKLVTLTDEDKMNWIKTIFEQLTINQRYRDKRAE